ncbi:MAG TPA: metallophosphoesterase [Candidatus Limnocylindria bacterium]|jgi:predicted MPP superfamily phosphohydrolase|nr:metallophosphoesterase [Candidatus Limnocylindria bacterium]
MDHRFNRRRFLTSAFVAAPLALGADAAVVEPHWLRIRTVSLAKGPVRHRFIHCTDIHHKGDEAYLRHVVAEINGLRPDFVCFTGDLIEERQFVAPALEILRELKAPLYGIPGNHDHWSRADFGPIRVAFAATGGAWLQDAQLTIRDGAINLMGLDRLPARFVTDPARFNLLLVHYPEWADRQDGRKYDLMLAGHSHGGQVRLPGIGPLVMPTLTGNYDMGLFETPGGPLYVNPGIGTFQFNVRFNCRPELTVFEI